MIDTIALRRGNVIAYRKGIGTVIAIAEKKVTISVPVQGKDEPMELEVSPDDINEIRITEKQLGHLGFQMFERPYGPDFVRDHICITQNVQSKKEDPYFYYVGFHTKNQLKSEQKDFVVPMVFVHQVQNFCFEHNVILEYEPLRAVEVKQDKKIISR